MKITEPVEETIQQTEEEPIVEEQPTPVKVDKLKQIVKCPDCNMGMTQHTLKYIHKRRGFCKAIKAEPGKKHQNQNTKNNYIKYCK